MKKFKDFIKKHELAEKSQDLLNRSKPALKHLGDKGQSLYMASSVFVSDLSHVLGSSDFVRGMNEYKSELSKAMDEGFKIGTVDLETQLKFMPNNHRILDGGHGFFESIEKAQEVGRVEGWSDADTFVHWFKAYFTDMSSSAGMPLFDGATDNIYDLLRELGINEETARDLVTINGQEALEALVGGTLTALSILFAWKKQDKECFSRALGSIALGAVVSLNPVALVILIVAAGVGYNTLVCKNAVQRGGVLSFVALGTGLLIPGPLVIGVIPGIVLGIYANKKMGKDFVPSEFLSVILYKAQDPKLRQSLFIQMAELLKKRNVHGAA